MEEESYIHRILESVFKHGRLVDTESLCVVPGELVWCIAASVRVLDISGGNALDCASAGLLLALMSFRRESAPRSSLLSFNFLPVVITFCTIDFKDSTSLLCDPLLAEEAYASGSVTMAIDPSTKDLVAMYKRGCTLPMHSLSAMLDESLRIATRILSNIRSYARQ